MLKAVGNIGFEEESTAVINNCIKKKSLNPDLTLAAIDALRRKPCNDERNKKIWELFLDTTVLILVYSSDLLFGLTQKESK